MCRVLDGEPGSCGEPGGAPIIDANHMAGSGKGEHGRNVQCSMHFIAFSRYFDHPFGRLPVQVVGAYLSTAKGVRIRQRRGRAYYVGLLAS